MLYLLIIIGAIFTQSDWVSGPGVLGPVTDWDKAFYQHDSITYNNQGQICPIATDVDYTIPWFKHIIDSNDISYHSIWPADFDNDGDIDFAGWKGDVNQLVFYENDGSNGFTAVATYVGPNSSNWGMIYAADLDNNGLIDVVVPGGASGGLKWYQNNGGFSFTPHTIPVPVGPCYFVYGGDIDNDNDTDLVFSRKESPTEIWENTGGSFSLKQSIPETGWRVKFANLNNDGWVDLVIGDVDTRVKVYLNDLAGNFISATTFASPNNDALWIRDIDNDGDLDIVNGMPPGIRWMESDGSGIGWTEHIVYPGNFDTSVGDGGCVEDFDFDGLADIASGFKKLFWFRQISSDSFIPYLIDDPGPTKVTHWIYPMKLGGGTCFQSGNVDLLVCWSGEFAWYENQMAQDFTHGWLTSSILEIHNSQERELLWLGWEACVPATSTLAFYWRADNSATGIVTKPWIGTHYSIVGETIRDSAYIPRNIPCYRYFQYKTEFWPCAGDAPIVYKVWLTDTICGAVGVEEETGNRHKAIGISLEVYPNPSFGNALIKYGLPEKASISLRLYDISGRLVKTIYSGIQEKGYHNVRQNELSAGIYFIKLDAGDYKATRKLTILR